VARTVDYRRTVCGLTGAECDIYTTGEATRCDFETSLQWLCSSELDGYVDLHTHFAFDEQDALTLCECVFSDSHGAADPSFLSLRIICKALDVKLPELRERFRKVCPLEEFLSKVAPKGGERKHYIGNERKQERLRGVAALMAGTKTTIEEKAA
jgi:hypothetical protein